MASAIETGSKGNVVVIGAGVIGLSTALKIQEKGYAVTILAETLPSDPKSIRYTSHWAGAHHVSHAGDSERNRMEKETFRVMWEMSAPGSDTEGCFLRLPQAEYYIDKRVNATGLEHMPDYRRATPSEIASVPGAVDGAKFTTITIDTPVYLNYLLSLFLGRGGRVVRTAIQHISQAADGSFIPKAASDQSSNQVASAVIVCSGLGARSLGGVEDKDVHPIRGQTVLIRAPWVRFGRTLSGSHENDMWTYVIPRRSGDVIIGGTKIADDWYPHPRKETTADILARCLAICPELDPNYVAAASTPSESASDANVTQASIDAVRALIIEEGCGLRPGRHGGIRLEKDVLTVHVGSAREERRVPVVYNYGHAGFGYQSSWGSAIKAVELLEKVLKEVN